MPRRQANKCSVNGCDSFDDTVLCHQFPRDPDKCNRWLTACRLDFSLMDVCSRHRWRYKICTHHFADTDYRFCLRQPHGLFPNAIPNANAKDPVTPSQALSSGDHTYSISLASQEADLPPHEPMDDAPPSSPCLSKSQPLIFQTMTRSTAEAACSHQNSTGYARLDPSDPSPTQHLFNADVVGQMTPPMHDSSKTGPSLSGTQPASQHLFQVIDPENIDFMLIDVPKNGLWRQQVRQETLLGKRIYFSYHKVLVASSSFPTMNPPFILSNILSYLFFNSFCIDLVMNL